MVLINLDLDIVDFFYKYQPTYKEINSFLYTYKKNVVLLATDKQKIPKYIKKLSKFFGVPIFSPDRDISLNFKHSLLKKFKYIIPKEFSSNNHLLDAFAAAYYARLKLNKQFSKYLSGKLSTKEDLLISLYSKIQESYKHIKIIDNTEHLQSTKLNSVKLTKYKPKNKKQHNKPPHDITIYVNYKTKYNNNEDIAVKYKRLKSKYLESLSLLKDILYLLSKNSEIAIKYSKLVKNKDLLLFAKSVYVDIEDYSFLDIFKNNPNVRLFIPSSLKQRLDKDVLNKENVYCVNSIEDFGSFVIVHSFEKCISVAETNDDKLEKLIKDLVKKYKYKL